MNRNDEYNELMNELNDTPLKLDFTFERAQLRLNAQKTKSHTRKTALAPVWFVTAVFAVFVLLVNISPTFAYAAGRIPYIKDLAQFVAMSPSLSAAVENEYVQPIGQEQTAEGITAKVEYVIVDQKQMNIFYSLASNTYTTMDAYPEVYNTDGKPLENCSLNSGDFDIENGMLRKITVDFKDGTLPNTIKLKLKVRDNGTPTRDAPIEESDNDILTKYEYTEPVYIAELDFILQLDPSFTAKGEEIELNKAFTADGQNFVLNTAEIYPTHMRFTFDDTNENTAWLVGLDFYVENEKGERFEGISNGITAFGKPDSPMMQTYMLESAFFSKSQRLTLFITGTTWLDKDMETVHVNLANKSADDMPEGVNFEYAKKMKNGWKVIFSAPELKENCSYPILSWDYYDADKNEYHIESMFSSGGGYYDYDKNLAVDLPGRFVEEFALIDYPYDEVWLSPSFSRRVTLDTPISIQIK